MPTNHVSVYYKVQITDIQRQVFRRAKVYP